MKRRPTPFVTTLDQRPALHQRRAPKQRRSQELVADILVATERLLVADGPAAVTSKRIAAAAGVSIGSLYQYFPTSLAVLRALLERHLGSIEGEVAGAISSARDQESLLAGVLDGFLAAKLRRSALSLALRNVEPLIEGQLVEQATIRRVGDLLIARLAAFEPTQSSPSPWQVDLAVSAISGAVGHALGTDPDRLTQPWFKASLLRMAKSALAPT